MNKILIMSLVIISIIGVVVASAISLSNYVKIGKKTSIDTEGICNEKVCDKNTPKSLLLQDSGLKIDVLKDNKTNKEILNIHYPK